MFKPLQRNFFILNISIVCKNIVMGTTNGGLLGKNQNMKVTKCEIQYIKTFRKGYWRFFSLSLFFRNSLTVKHL